MARRNGVKGEVAPAVRRIIDGVEASFDAIVARSVERTWAQVPAYAASPDEGLHAELTAHVDAVFRAALTSLSEARSPQRSDFPVTWKYAANRVRQGVALSDFLKAYRIGQVTLWEGLLETAKDDPEAREAALTLATHVMQVIEVGSTVAAEAFLHAHQHQVAESDRVRRDLLEDLLAGRDLSPGPKQAMLRSAGLEPATSVSVASAAPIRPLLGDWTLRDAVSAVREAVGASYHGLTVVRQDEVVTIFPVRSGGMSGAADALEKAIARLSRQGIPLAVGISTAHKGLTEVPEAYAEACVARDGLRGEPGVLALPQLSTFDYLVLREDETARRLIRPALRRFVEEDQARGGALISTLLEYIASDLNAKVAAERLHMHVNTAYYRLDRIAERTGCDLRRLADVQELLIAVRLLSGRPPAASPPEGR
ncbi:MULTISPECIES: PucR family transcriptional regulator [Saccharopolyspora]|uniref:PucR family transcriptional regulator n=2 Tax=Saccharopolyspora TaxID=1835 RepID=A0A4V2YB58_9PSEU|nr:MULTISPECIES: helix-turn-helix domain-containing protein [Saccharopolyspora]MEB3366623.1 helix-turn-helix domain-containing protein [Saccharopolyspora sp. S2-29]TDD06396.1 PucR family transcriptional regulator [Saccharopolyspora terrae]